MEGDLRPMVDADVCQVSAIHLEAFTGFFLTYLGYRFLCELYQGILQDKSGIALVYVTNDRVMGAIAGTTDPEGFYRRLLINRWWRFAWAALMPSLRQPGRIPRLLRAFSRGAEKDVHAGCATLLSIAVHPQAQGKGIGKKLVKAFLHKVAASNVRRVNLTTDRDGNDTINQFYLELGFSLVQHYTILGGREMNEYMIDLDPGSIGKIG